jgi:hypothetical protein
MADKELKKKSGSGSGSQEVQACKLVMCENPTTGEIEVKREGPCPPGFMEKIRDKCQESGLTFVIPKVYTKEE